MNSSTKYKNGNLKVKDPDNIKYEYEDLKEDVIESKALKKFVRGKIGFKDVSKDIYITQATTYCYFFQEPIEQLINRYKKNQKELSDDETEEDLDVYYDMTDYANHALDNKQAKNTIQNKVRRMTSFLRKNGVTVPPIDVGLNRYDDSEGYFTKKDLPDKETVKMVISECKPKHKAVYAFMYTSGSGRAETCALKVKSVIDGLAEFSEETEPKAIVKDVDGRVAEEIMIPIIKMTRKKTGKPYYTVITPECTQLMIDYIKTDVSLLDDLDTPFFKLGREGLSTHFQRINIRHGWGKRGRYNFWSSHRLRHNHYTQINNHDLANALEGRVVHNPITKTYDHNLDDPEYLREKYKDHMHKFEIFDHYDITIRDEEVRRLQEENEELRKQIAKTQEAVEDLGYKIESNRTNIPYHKVHDAITSYLKSIDVMDNNRASLLNLMVLDHVKSNPNEFKDDEEYLLDLVKKLDIKIELSSKDIIQQHIELAQNMDYDDIDPTFIMFLDELVDIIQKNEAVMKRVGFINVDKFDYVAESYLVNSGIIPDISKVDLSQFTQDDKERIAGEILIRYIDTD